MTDNQNEQQPETFTAEQMSEVRNEAKTWRQKLRAAEAERDELRTQVNDLTTARDTATAERDQAITERDELKAAGELAGITREIAESNGIPAEALRGSTREELEAHAAVLKPVYTKAHGVYIPSIGDTPGNSSNELGAFVSELFGNG